MAACTLEDSDRCSGGDFDYRDGSCLLVQDSEDDDGDDGFGDWGTDGPTGLEETCVDAEEDCRDFDASFCLKDPNGPPEAEGACVIPDCTKDPDNCPEEHLCCDFGDVVDGILGVGSICVHESAYSELETQVMGCDG